MSSIVHLDQATLKRGDRTLWSNVSLDIKAGEFIAILGPNGSGKTSLLKTLLGVVPLTSGQAKVLDKIPKRGNDLVGYIPQQKGFDAQLPIRGRDLVSFGLDGHHYGLSIRKSRKQLVDKAIAEIDATAIAEMPIGLLSGGEQQRLRIAQAIVGGPRLLLCDEPLLSLDLTSQAKVVSVLNNYRLKEKATVMFVTHEINPVLPYVDRILYLANGRWLIDRPDNVLRSETLSHLYGSSVEVLRLKDRVLVVGAEDEALTTAGAHHSHEGSIGDAH